MKNRITPEENEFLNSYIKQLNDGLSPRRLIMQVLIGAGFFIFSYYFYHQFYNVHNQNMEQFVTPATKTNAEVTATFVESRINLAYNQLFHIFMFVIFFLMGVDVFIKIPRIRSGLRKEMLFAKILLKCTDLSIEEIGINEDEEKA